MNLRCIQIFFEILSYSKKVGIKVGLTTNGAGLGRKVGEKLLDYPLYQIDISVQTPDAKSFNLRKSHLVFDDYLKGILNFFQHIT